MFSGNRKLLNLLDYEFLIIRFKYGQRTPTKIRQKPDKKPTKPDIKNFQTLKTDKTRHQFWCVGGHPRLRSLHDPRR